jgi:hypothetical protein
MDVIPSNIILQAAAAATFVKVLIDILKMATDPPRWAPPALAVSGGIGIILLLMVAGDVALTRAAIANAILAGIMAGGTAVGVTELSKRANPIALSVPRVPKVKRARQTEALLERSRREDPQPRGIDGPRL